jgi:NADH:ubiquinone oxidoreductase subunit 6 (subunit J)
MKFPSLLVLLVAVLALFAGAARADPRPQPKIKLPSADTFKKIGNAIVSPFTFRFNLLYSDLNLKRCFS